MLIAYLTSQYPASSHTFIRREVAALRRRGTKIVTFSVRKPSPSEIIAQEDKDEFLNTGYILPAQPIALIKAHVWAIFSEPSAYFRTLILALRHRAPGLKAMLWALFHFLEAILLARMLQQAKADRLHNHFANAGANVGLLAAKFLNIPWSLTLHGISETDYPAGLLLPEKVRMADFVACVSWFGRAQAMRITPPSEWSKFIISRCGVDKATLPDKASIEKVSGRILCVGRLSPEKGQAGLIEAFAALRRAGSKATLRLVGDGPARSALENQVSNLGLENVVTFTGRKSEKDTLAEIAAAEIFVLPSFMEGLPVVLMEAMALEVPVISSQVAGIPELVAHEKTGLLFAPSDWEGLAQTIKRLMADKDLAGDLAKNAKTHMLQEFEIDIAVGPVAAKFDESRLSTLAELSRPCD